MAKNIDQASSIGLDAAFPRHEQFPRHVAFAFVPVGDKRCHIYVEPLHGPLRRVHTGAADLDCEGDGYRWSHAFNLAYMAILGWSPVARALLGLKRRSDRTFEKAEDGARAQMMEEAMSALIFHDAEANGFYERTGDIPQSLVDEVCWIAHHYEARQIKAEGWRTAIQQGYKIWRSLRARNGGIVELNLNDRHIQYRPLPSVPHCHVSDLYCDAPARADSCAIRPPQEQFPPRATFMLVETKQDVAELFVDLSHGGYVNIGSKAEEWSHGNDGFRWHDVFHLANAAVLGWSPVIRSLLGLERRSNPIVWGREDDLRAQIAEEAFGVLAFGRAKEFGWFEARVVPPVVRLYMDQLLGRYEVMDVPHELRERALLDGFDVWRSVRKAGGGLIDLDFVGRSIAYRPIADTRHSM
ncbi:MAG: hypothetical protein J0H49_09700 [Acidobacteria bacterium]|nr:hypothetical protein [Acidobacteriota bacterium]